MTKLGPRGGFRQDCRQYLGRRGALVGAAIVLAASGQRAGAQQFTASGAWTVTSEDEGVGTVRGGELRWQQPAFQNRLMWRLGARHAQRDLRRLGTLCIEPIASSYCDVQSIERTNQMSTVSLGVGRDAGIAKSVQLLVFADLLAGRLRSREFGQQSRASRTESDALVGAQAGVDGTRWFSARSPVGLNASALFGVIKPAGLQGCGDCWLPFTSTFSITQLSLGATVRFTSSR